MYEVHGSLNEVPVGTHQIEDAVRHGDAELRLECEGQLDEIERISCQVVPKGHLAHQLLEPHAEGVSDHTSHTQFLVHLLRPFPRMKRREPGRTAGAC